MAANLGANKHDHDDTTAPQPQADVKGKVALPPSRVKRPWRNLLSLPRAQYERARAEQVVYPYLLRSLAVTRPDQVCAMDII